ncbi:hypothetical protein ACLOJK_013898 [Asimina triloba]
MDSSALEENVMSESAGKKASKWDLAADIVENQVDSGEADQSCHEKETNSGWESSKKGSSYARNGLGMEADSITVSKDLSGWSKRGSAPTNKDEVKVGEEKSPTKRMDSGDKIWDRVDTWKKRSRSPSPRSRWSRSHRKRSRSPSHGYKRESDGWNDRSRSRTSGSAEPCRNFAAGRCKLGRDCRFLHQDAHDYDDRRRYSRISVESWGGRQERGKSPEYASHEVFSDSHGQDKHSDGYGSRFDVHRERHESQRSIRSSELCKNFLRGRCHRGSSCKFLHDSVSADGHDEWSSKSGKRERVDTREPDNSGRDWRCEPRWNTDIPCKYFAEGQCRNGENCKFSHQVVDSPEGRKNDDKSSHDLGMEHRPWDAAKWDERSTSQNLQNSPTWWRDNSARVGSPGSRMLNGPKWSDKEPHKDTSNSPQWRSNNSVGWDVPESTTSTNKFHHSDCELKSQNFEDANCRVLPEVSSDIPTQHLSTGMSMTQVIASDNSYVQQNPGQNRSNQQIAAPPSVQCFDPKAESLNPNIKNHWIVLPIQNGQTFNPIGQQVIPQSLTKRSDAADSKLSSVTSGMLINQGTATNEQVPQVTNVSASLAHIFGNGLQLPQLYASLNLLSATGAVPSLPYSQTNSSSPLASIVAPNKPNEASWPKMQYDPIHDSVESAKPVLSDQPPGFFLNSNEQKKVAAGNSPASLRSLPLPATGECQKFGGSLEETLHHENQEIQGTTNERVNEEAEQGQIGDCEKEQQQTGQSEEQQQQTGQSEKDRHTNHAKDMEADGELNEEGKRSKDDKALRLLKFAVVESVKELLKPSWKEGHLTREAHKTIVKKVVDKVIGSISSPHIPQTQEKVDLYLESNKSKLTKLVQDRIEALTLVEIVWKNQTTVLVANDNLLERNLFLKNQCACFSEQIMFVAWLEDKIRVS